jgi:hypothetical protein
MGSDRIDQDRGEVIARRDIREVGRPRHGRCVDSRQATTWIGDADTLEDRQRIGDRAWSTRREQTRVQRPLHFDAEHECGPGDSDDEEIEPERDAKPQVDLKQRTAEKDRLRPLNERPHLGRSL